MPAPTLAEDPDDEAPTDDQPDETDADTDTMPEQTDPETDGANDEDTPPEPDPEAEAEPDSEGEGENEYEDEPAEQEEVAEATMPEDAGEAEAEDDSGGGLLGQINTKAIIALAAVVVVGLALLWLLRQGGRIGTTVSATEEELDEEMAHDGGGEGEYDINAPETKPLEQDAQIMGMLGMGSDQPE